MKSLAIPLLASGSYGFPKGIALRIALSEIESFMSENDIELYLVFFDEKSYSLSTELYGDIDEYINKHYVEEKVPEEYPDGVHRRKSGNDHSIIYRSVTGAHIDSVSYESSNAKRDFAENGEWDDTADSETAGLPFVSTVLFDDEAEVWESNKIERQITTAMRWAQR